MRKEDEMRWDRMTFAMLRDGGTWGVPRSGLIFKKAVDHLELHDIMPFMPEMKTALLNGADVPGSAEELKRYQRQDFTKIQNSFNAAGIEISDPKELLIDRHVTVEKLQGTINERK
jgi:hypothetical protein